MTHPQIRGIGTANPPIRLTQEQSFYAIGYQRERIRRTVLNSDIEYGHFYFGGVPNLEETSDQQNERYLSGAMKTGCRAIMNCLGAASAKVDDVDLLAVCSCTGYVCPDVGSRLIAHMRFKKIGAASCGAYDRTGATAVAAEAWTFAITSAFLDCSSGWTQGDR